MSVEEWDAAAAAYDQEPDHGLRDPAVREAWRRLLLDHLPTTPARVADLGCGTGTLAALLVAEGYQVHGVDSSPRMLAQARAKVRSEGAGFTLGDAADPRLTPGLFDVVLCRHVLWALPDPDAALARWQRLLTAEGRLLLVEGRWSTGAGLTADQTTALVLGHRREAEVVRLEDPAYWGGPITDERYLVSSLR